MGAGNDITDKVQEALRNFLQSTGVALSASETLPDDQIYKGIQNTNAAVDENAPETRKLPCVECVCVNAEVDDPHFLNWRCDVEVRARANADDTTETDFAYFSEKTFEVIATDTLAADLSGALADFTAFLVNFQGQSWDVIDRSWQAVMRFEVFCAGSDIV